MISLPIDSLLPQIKGALREQSNLVIEAPAGAGKTTRVPPALLEIIQGEILVLEPRRLAARMAARRVAQEMGERVGETVGYQVRFDEAVSARTRIKFMTEGVLTRRFLDDPELTRVGAVVLDEFHERHLDADLALALLRNVQNTKRPELQIIVMSATLNAQPIAQYLGSCPTLRSEGRLFDLEISYTPHSAQPLPEQVSVAVDKLLSKRLNGDVLVFLPGAAEIREASRALEPAAKRANLLLVPLHGDLSLEDQDTAVTTADRRKIILSTNIAESSLTIEGVTAVIDSGLARVAVDSPWNGLPSVEVRRISQASATQRAGRAGRTAPGRVVRLYTAEEFHRRPKDDVPEILRRELSGLLLQVRAMGLEEKLQWLDPPSSDAWAAAEKLLNDLDADVGMARLPLPPRLAKLVKEAEARGVPDKGCAAAAVLSAGERGSPDLLTLLDSAWRPETKRAYEQLRRLVPGRDRAGDSALLHAVLAAYPDRVARHRRDGELLLAGGGSARFPGCRQEFIVALDAEVRGTPLVRLAAGPIPQDWLLDRAEARSTLEWNREAERVEEVDAFVYGRLVIAETKAPAKPSPEAAAMLWENAKQVDIGRFVDRDELEQLRARAAFAGLQIDPDKALEELCGNCISFAELSKAGLLAKLRPERLDQFTPDRLRLAGGREVKVHYEPGKPPWIQSRLQDFFGMKETPRVGTTAVVVHLLAPNQRPVQVTSDLAGFWERLYPTVRKELMRRYPKHKWPEKP